jgi:uncharacterized membrane protein
MKIGIILLVLLVLLPSVIAAPVDFNVVKYDIQGNSVYVKNEISFHLDKDEEIEVKLPVKYTDLNVNLAGDDIFPDVKDNIMNITVPKESNLLIIEYRTKDFLERSTKNFFITEFENPLIASFVFFELKLPEGSVLDSPVDEGKSAYPEPKEVISDGQRIIVKWQKEEVEKGDKTAIFVTYKDGKENVFIFIIPLIGIIGVLVYLLFKKPKKEVKEKVVSKPDLHLKEEEKQIVRIIERKGGKINQGTLVTISDFSKTKVSQLVRELEERKIIKKVKKGKKNTLVLKGKLLDLE